MGVTPFEKRQSPGMEKSDRSDELLVAKEISFSCSLLNPCKETLTTGFCYGY